MWMNTLKLDFSDRLSSNSDTRYTSFFTFENSLIKTSIKKIPKYGINLTSIKAKRSTIQELFDYKVDYNDDIYIFEIMGKTNTSTFSWNIYKNNKQIKELFEQIKKEVGKKDYIYEEDILIKCKIVRNYTNGEMYRNIGKIAEYIMYIYNNTNPDQPVSLKEALRISKTSFTDNIGLKPFEGYAYKQAEPRLLRTLLKIFLFPIEYFFFNGWNKRWILLKNDMICYLNDPNTLVGKNVYWFDEDINISIEKEKILTIKNLSRKLTLKFDSRFERDLWKKEIETKAEKKKEQIYNNIYHSFTTQKTNCGAKWFVDADSYFTYLFEQLKNAKESVYVTDWFMSPELALKRPINYNNFLYGKNDYKENLNFSNVSRLMDIFYLLAKKGVKIYILLFYEVKMALAINSLYAKTTLNKLHDNIKVTRHPKSNSAILWSHHEKLVVIDQKIAFVGGLDLCWGRYDTNNHPIVEEENPNSTYYYPGADYVNERQEDMHEVNKYYKEQIDRRKKPRMAWHDVHSMVEGPIVSDIARHFVERWNDARFNKRNNGLVTIDTSKSLKKEKTIKKPKKDDDLDNIKNDINNMDEILEFNIPSKTLKIDSISSINKMNLNSNFGKIKEEENDDDEEDNNDNIINTHTNINKNNSIFNSVYDNIIKEDDKFQENDSDNDSNEYKGRFTIFNAIKKKVTDYKTRKNKKLKLKQSAFFMDDYEQRDQTIEMNFKIQALRSVSQWSIGKTLTEHSILEGYYKLIDNSKHYIYIENQFFITKSYSELELRKSGLNLNRLVQNEIGLHIRARIERAYKEKENFKVFICIPLLPGFSGTPGESSTINCILKHTLQSISQNKGMSLLELLAKKMGNDVNKYIYFYSLRNHGTIKGMPVTELIYIHSKLLIVDDEKVLIGSANINDRSMLGSRDSEFAIIIEEDKKVESVMNNKKYMASKFALSLRKHLMAEHLGLKIDDKILNDPINENLWTELKSRANVNSVIYNDIFDCYPDNKFNNFSKLRERKKIKTDKDKEKLKKEYKSKIIGVYGHVVEYPINFLKDQELDIDFFSKENFVPEKNFV